MSNFKYNYVPVDQLEPKSVLLEPGKAHFVIKTYYDKDKDGLPSKTQAGLPKVTLSLTITDCHNQSGMVYDIITSNTAWKIHQLSEALGMPGLYNQNGTLDLGRVVGQEGECTIKTDERPGFAAKTVIDRYLAHHAGAVPEAQNHSTIDTDDDLPF